MVSGAIQGNGLIHHRCAHSVQETADRLETALTKKGLHVFARIDHSQAAMRAGIKMRPTQVLLFGSPAVGTPMMMAPPTLAIDLPSKVLVSEDEAGVVWLTYNSPDYLKNRHSIPESFSNLLEKLGSLLDDFAKVQQRTPSIT